MPNISEKPLAHVHWRVYKEDLDRLKAMFGTDHGGMNRAVRAMLHSWLNMNYAKLHAAIDEIEAQQAAQIDEEDSTYVTDETHP
jgi:hypothetical protein